MQEDLLAAEVDLGEEVMIEVEDMIVDMPLEGDIVEDIEVDLGATLHIEIFLKRTRWPLVLQYCIRTERLGASARSPVQIQVINFSAEKF